jgi:HEPN domain-containing protein
MAQAQRDLRAADHLLHGGFGAHATVMAHLAVEKALKALYRSRTDSTPPVTHDLRVLADALDVPAEATVGSSLLDALDTLADVSLLSLYAPDRPFGHAVSARHETARERVAAAHAWIGWIGTHLDDAPTP